MKGHKADYFAALSWPLPVCKGVMSFGATSFATRSFATKSFGGTSFRGGQVSSRLVSAPDSPSVENFSGRASRRPSGESEVSVKSNRCKSASDRIDARFMRSPQTSNPADLAGGNVKFSGFAAPVEIETVANAAVACAGRWKSSSNWSALKQNSRHCDMR